METINAWSYSRLTTFEQCKLRAKLAYIDRIPEPILPLPPGKIEHANHRGTRIHTAAEAFVKNDVELIPELGNFREEFFKLRELYRSGKVLVECEWAFTDKWELTMWNSFNVWVRVKLDAFIQQTKTHGVIIDYKTGKKHGNEIKHTEQGQLYQLAAFLLYPKLNSISVEFWYTDINDITQMFYEREQGLRFLQPFTARGNKLTTATKFPANPNIVSCRWCPYSSICDESVQTPNN